MAAKDDSRGLWLFTCDGGCRHRRIRVLEKGFKSFMNRDKAFEVFLFLRVNYGYEDLWRSSGIKVLQNELIIGPTVQV